MALNFMKRTYTIKSEHLGRDMQMSVYGKYGFALLLFPSTTDDYLEAENSGLIDSISHEIESGKCKVFALSSANFDSWLNKKYGPELKSQKHLDFNNFLMDEVIPIIFELCGGPVPVFTVGCGLGAYHAANTYFRRPDIFYGTIAISGTFNIYHFTNGYFDENCYYNSPIHYLPNLNDNYWLSFLLSRKHVYIYSGSGDNEYPENVRHLQEILNAKGIPNQCDVWGKEYSHDYDSWNRIFSFIIQTKL